MKKSRYPSKGAAPREEKTAPSKTAAGWCPGCQARRTVFGGRCTVCWTKAEA